MTDYFLAEKKLELTFRDAAKVTKKHERRYDATTPHRRAPTRKSRSLGQGDPR